MNETNVWRKRLTTSLECPSGNVATVRRPGPDLALKAGKIARIFQKQKPNEDGDIDKQLEFIASLPDDELDKLMSFARVLITDVVIQPSISLHPKEGQLGPDDVPLNDFWFIFTWAMNGGPTMPVRMQATTTELPDGTDLKTEGETSIEDVRNFSSGQGTSPDVGEDSERIQ